ncbi:hypothetical protein [Polaromonas vacuolata]|nr:hypothetical protein [Polaromonas vacuolata]
MRYKPYFFDSRLRYCFWGRFNPAWAIVFSVLLMAMALGLIVWCAIDIYISRQHVLVLAEERKTFNTLATSELKSTQLKSLSHEQRMAVKAVVDQLNISWHQVFEQLEKQAPEGIALLSIEPDGKNAVIKFQAEAKSLDSLLFYASSMENSGLFGRLSYTKHETFEQDPSKPIRLSFELGLIAPVMPVTPVKPVPFSSTVGNTE